jgi:hypothetical protein
MEEIENKGETSNLQSIRNKRTQKKLVLCLKMNIKLIESGFIVENLLKH